MFGVRRVAGTAAQEVPSVTLRHCMRVGYQKPLKAHARRRSNPPHLCHFDPAAQAIVVSHMHPTISRDFE